MKAYPITTLIAQVRRAGGKLRIKNGELQLRFLTSRGKRAQTKRTAALAQLVRANTCAIKAVLYEEAAELAYQRSGCKPDWWREYDRGADVNVAPDDLVHTTMPDAADITTLPPEACFSELKRLLAEYEASGVPRHPRPATPASPPLISPRIGLAPRGYKNMLQLPDFAAVQAAHREACRAAGGQVIRDASQDPAYMARLRALFRRAKCATEVVQ
jgi:hypothetical protein